MIMFVAHGTTTGEFTWGCEARDRDSRRTRDAEKRQRRAHALDRDRQLPLHELSRQAHDAPPRGTKHPVPLSWFTDPEFAENGPFSPYRPPFRRCVSLRATRIATTDAQLVDLDRKNRPDHVQRMELRVEHEL
jgi:hypothetical protein